VDLMIVAAAVIASCAAGMPAVLLSSRGGSQMGFGDKGTGSIPAWDETLPHAMYPAEPSCPLLRYVVGLGSF
jgi:hypothetical protein